MKRFTAIIDGFERLKVRTVKRGILDLILNVLSSNFHYCKIYRGKAGRSWKFLEPQSPSLKRSYIYHIKLQTEAAFCRFSATHLFWKAQPANIHLLNVNNRNTRKRCEICSKLTKNSRTTSMTSFVLMFLLFILNIFYIFFQCFYY